MNFNLPVVNTFDVPVADLLNIPEIDDVLATEILNASVDGPRSTTEDSGETKASPTAGSRNEGKCQRQETKQEKHGSSQTSRSISDIRENGIVDDPTKEEPRVSPRKPSVVLPTGQHVHILNDVEANNLRLRLSARVASLSRDRREKEEMLPKKKQIQELKAELARLNYLEAQQKIYGQRPLESLQEELQIHQQEIADLTKKLEKAAQETLDWAKSVSENGNGPGPMSLRISPFVSGVPPRRSVTVEEDLLALPDIQKPWKLNTANVWMIFAVNPLPNRLSSTFSSGEVRNEKEALQQEVADLFQPIESALQDELKRAVYTRAEPNVSSRKPF